MSGTVKGRDTIDCVRTLNCVQALDVMEFEIREGDGLSCRISARGVELQGFGREPPETLRAAPKAPVSEIFDIFGKKIVS